MPLVKRPTSNDTTKDLVDFTIPMPRGFVDAYEQLQTEIDTFLADQPEGTTMEKLADKLQQGTRQTFLAYARRLKKEENVGTGVVVSNYLDKHPPKPRLTAEEKKLQELRDKAKDIQQTINKLSAEGAPEDKIQQKQKAHDKLKARIKRLELETKPT